MKRFLALLCCALLVCLSFAGCGEDKNAGKTMEAMLSAEPATLDPQVAQGSESATIINSLYEGLTRLDKDGKAKPGVAESWQANADSTQFTFHLRKDAVWNGSVPALTKKGEQDKTPTPVTAADFVFAWRRALDPETDSPLSASLLCLRNAAAFRAGQAPAEQLGVQAQDAHTLLVTLAYSCPDFPALASQGPFMPCNEAFFNSTTGQYGLERSAILGNGPFYIPNWGWNHQANLKLRRAETYKGDSAAVPSAVEFTIGAPPAAVGEAPTTSAAGSGKTAFQALQDGSLDVAALDAADLAPAKQAGMSITSFADTTWGLCFQTKGKFQSSALRAAFVQALDRAALLANLPDGTVEATGILPPATLFGGQPYREKAGKGYYLPRSAAAAAAYRSAAPEGLSVTLLCTEENKKAASEALATWNSSFQTFFNLSAVSQAELNKRLASGNFDVALAPFMPDNTDARTALGRFASTQSTGNPAQLKDSAYDSLLAAGGSLEALKRAERYLADKAVFYPLYTSSHSYVARPGVSGMLFHGFSGGMDFRGAGKN